MVCFFLS